MRFVVALEVAEKEKGGPVRTLNRAHADPISDRWTIDVWHAVAEMLHCLYFYEEEGAFDRAGRWKRQRIRHCLVGAHANQAQVIGLALHLCALARQRACEDAASKKATPQARRSFEWGCAQRLASRLRKRATEQRSCTPTLFAAENKANLAAAEKLRLAVPSKLPPSVHSINDDAAARRRGQKAGTDASLVLRSGLRSAGKRTAQPAKKQHSFDF